MPALTVKDLVLLHLSKYRRYRDKRVVPEDITQNGIAEAVGVKRSHLSVELRRMQEKALIGERKAHAGPGNQKKVYFNLPAGDRRVFEILEQAEKKRVAVESRAGSESMNGMEAVNLLMRKTSITYPLALKEVLSRKVIDIDDVMKRTTKPYSTPILAVERLYGRDAEKKRLRAWYKGKTPTMVIIGPGGIGKSTLAADFARETGDPVFWYRVLPGESPAASREAVADFLQRNGEEEAAILLSDGPITGKERVEAILGSIRRRCLVVLDDYHLAEETFKNVMAMVREAMSSANTGCKMLILSRSVPRFYSRKDMILGRTVEEIFLRGLSESGARELLDSMKIEMDEDTFRSIFSRSAGHPMAIQMAGNAGEAEEAMGKYLEKEFYASLSPDEREILSRLAAFRRPVPGEAFIDEEEEAETLQRLMEKGFVHYEMEGNYFIHETIKQAVSASTDLGSAHSRAAGYYETTELCYETVYHHIMAGEYGKAEDCLKRNVEHMLSSGQAVSLPDVLGRAPETGVFLVARARAMALAGNMENALELAEKAAGMEGSSYYVLAEAAEVHKIAGKYREAAGLLDRAEAMAGSEEERAFVDYVRGGLLFFTSDFPEAERRNREVYEKLMKSGEEYMAHIALGRAAMAMARQGRYEDALEALRECERYHERNGNHRMLGNTYLQMGIYEAQSGRREEARRYFEKAALYGDITGYHRLVGYALMNSADNYLSMGDTDRGLAYSLRAMKMFRDLGDEKSEAYCMGVVARAHLMAGERVEAENAYREAEKVLKERGEKRTLADMYMDRAELEEDSELKRKFYSRALSIARETGYSDGEKRAQAGLDGL